MHASPLHVLTLDPGLFLSVFPQLIKLGLVFDIPCIRVESRLDDLIIPGGAKTSSPIVVML